MISLCFNLRREALPLATIIIVTAQQSCGEFKSQTRSPSIAHPDSLSFLISLLCVSISDEKPFHWPPRRTYTVQCKVPCFNLRREALPLATWLSLLHYAAL